MIEWNDVALVLRGWLDNNRRLRVRVKAGQVDGTFMCAVRNVDAEEESVELLTEGNPACTLTCRLEGCFFEFTDGPERVRDAAQELESAVFIVGEGIDLAFVVLEEGLDMRKLRP